MLLESVNSFLSNCQLTFINFFDVVYVYIYSTAPIDRASWFSIITFGWVTPLFVKAWKGTLTTEDLTVGSVKDGAKENSKR